MKNRPLYISLGLVLVLATSLSAEVNPEQGGPPPLRPHVTDLPGQNLCADGNQPYFVRLGDRLWLKDRSWEANWLAFKAANPHIDLEARRTDYTADDKRVTLYVDDPLCGLGASGFEIRNAEQPRGGRDVRRLDGPPRRNLEEERVSPTGEADSDNSWPWWAWLIIGILLTIVALLLLAWYLTRAEEKREREEAAERQRRQDVDPATAGPPIVEGGIGSLPPADVAAHLDGLANARFGTLAGQPFRVGSLEHGRFFGPWTFGYADGSEKDYDCDGSDRFQGFRGLYRVPRVPNQVIEQFALQDCGNDAGRHRSRGGIFIPDNVVPVPQPPPTFGLVRARALEERLATTEIPEDPTVATGAVLTIVLDVAGVENRIEAESLEATRRLQAHLDEQLVYAAQLRRHLAVTEARAEEDRAGIADLIGLAARFGIALSDPRQGTLGLVSNQPPDEAGPAASSPMVSASGDSAK